MWNFAGFLLYPLVVHGLILLGRPQWAVMVLIGLCAASMLSLLRQPASKSRFGQMLFYVTVAAVGVLNLLTRSSHAVLIPFITVNVALTLFVWSSLRPGQVPLLSWIMAEVAGVRLSPAAAARTRVLTLIWAGFFGVSALVSLLLALLAPLEWWSWFSNVMYFVLLLALMLVMHGYAMWALAPMGACMTWVGFFNFLKRLIRDGRQVWASREL